jgi:hypothetical protein
MILQADAPPRPGRRIERPPMSVTCSVRVAACTAALSLALALAMTGTALAAAPATLPQSGPSASGISVDVDPGAVPTTPAVSPVFP